MISVRFKAGGKAYYFDPADLDVKTGDHVIVETARGIECGEVVAGPKDIPDSQVVRELKTVKRKEVAEKIKVARGYGDLSENSEYDEAKNEQGLVEGRIALLEKMLKHARVVTEDELSTDHISVGSHVRIKDEDGDEDEYDITGSTEADPVNGKISDESPIGAALIGHSVGDKVDITLPSGAVVQYEVMEIGRAEL